MNLFYHFSLTLTSILALGYMNLTSPVDLPDPISSPESMVAPIVDLGPDTVSCGPLQLDAGNAGSTFLWSTGATTQTIIVTASGTFWVDVTDGTGTTRDSIEVFIFANPVAPISANVDICGTGVAQAIVSNPAQQVLWYNMISGGSILTYGDTANIPVTASQTVYAENVSYAPRIVGELDNTFWTGTYSFGNGRGFRFDAYQDFILKSVMVYPTLDNASVPMTVDIELRNSADVVLESATFSFANPNATEELPLWFSVPTGSNHRLVINNLVGGKLYLNFSAPNLPFELPGIIKILNSIPSPNNYYFFYKWEIITDADQCVSSRTPVNINVLPNPSVDLGPDTVLCGGNSLALDITNTGATYQWSTGASSSNITVTSSGTIWGTATIGTCSSSDTTVVDIFPALSAPAGNNIDICGPGEVKVGALSNAQTILWYDAMTGGNVLGFGDSLTLNLTNSTSVYPEGISAVPQSVGPPLNNLGNGGTYNLGDGRGIQFDAYEDIIIQSIAVFPSQTSPSVPLTVDIELRDNLNNTLAVRPVVLNNPANKVEIPLWIPVSAGTTYSLVINHLQGGNLYLNFNNTGWPYEIPGVVKLIKSVPNSFNYYFLYDWKVITNDKFCVSNRSQIDVNVLPAPVVDLGKDTVLCGGNTLSLDVTNSGATYLWNTGQTSAAISVSTTDTFYVDVAIGNCSASDTVLVSAFSNPVVSGVADTTICGPQPVTMNVNSTGMQTLWYNASNPTTVAAFGESYSVTFPDTTTFLIQTLNGVSRNLGPEENTIGTGGTYSFGDGRGLRFDAYQDFLLKSVFVYPKTTNAGNPVMSFDIELRNAAGTVLNSRHITYQNPAQIKTEVELWFSVKAGTGQKLVINNLIGGNLFLNFNNSQFPYEFPGFAKITSSVESNNNNSSNYFFLYDWQILTDGFACKSNIVSKTINVNLPLSLPDSMYQCEPFVFDPQVFANSYSWSTGETTGPIFIDETGTYILTVSDGGSCTITDTLKVELAAPAGLPDDGLLCGNELTTNYNNLSTYLWSTNDTTSTLKISGPGVYSVIITEPNGCVLYDTIDVTGFVSFPVVDLGADTAVCVGITLDAGNTGASYLWSTGATTQTIFLNSTGLITVAVTDNNNCTTKDTISVNVAGLPNADFFISPNDTVYAWDFDVNFINLSTKGKYFWEFGDGDTLTVNNSTSPSQNHIYPDTGTYCVTLIVTETENDCGADTLTRCFTLLKSVTNLENELIPGLSIYPNPASEFVSIQFSESLPGRWRYHLMDLAGRKLFSKELGTLFPNQKEEVVLGSLPPNVYFLLVENEQMRQVFKIVKQ